MIIPLAAAGAIALGGVTAAEAKICANTYGGDVISATGVGCPKAREVVRTWAVRYRRDGVVNRRVFRFRCRDRSSAVEGLTVRCRRGDGATVRFYANVPA